MLFYNNTKNLFRRNCGNSEMDSEDLRTPAVGQIKMWKFETNVTVDLGGPTTKNIPKQ